MGFPRLLRLPLIVLVCCASVYGKDSVEHSGPVTYSLDLGRVKSDAKHRATARLASAATARTVVKIRTSCPCISARVDERDIPPHATAQIDISVDTIGRVGPFEGTVVVETMGERQQRHLINLKAIVDAGPRRIVCFPPTINVSCATGGRPIQQSLRVEDASGRSNGVLQARPTAKWIVVEKEQRSDKRRDYFIVTLTPPLDTEKVDETIEFISQEGAKEGHIAIRGSLRDPLILAPQEVLVVPGKSDYGVALLSADGVLPQLSTWKYQGRGITVEGLEISDGKLRLNVGRTAERGFASGAVFLYFDGYDKPEVLHLVKSPVVE